MATNAILATLFFFLSRGACPRTVQMSVPSVHKYLLYCKRPIIPNNGYVDLANDCLLQLLLYGDKDFPDLVNRHVLELPLNFIHKTGRFD